ncbi:MAG: 3,4-dihydroxy-2-butanone-4-phosphate synthase [Alphaproteobacteria bacterium CG11_big_fil_rev_8_21_14_0_20_44_7]|nr:MAG: 3,4-dihydroxy-2-butanone-4-phosphate synthase [Alphaproteobacteria bacterium CG11_big_fil_rev_8_21_14_0_20_44_7]
MSKELASIEQILEDAANGKMFILVDDEDRENEGDLIIPAQFADAEAVNFMAKHARGLICLALNSERVNDLNLHLMAQANNSRHQTAFTISIEAREGVTTGISAADRAHTIQTAINSSNPKNDIVSPGHIFPLMAKDGGVLVRAGHTEAAVDIARMAGLNPSGVICEIMNEDGTMARLDDLQEFASTHNLNIATIADLIAYRRNNEKLVRKIAETSLNSEFGGEFKMMIYQNTIEYAEHIILQKGEISKTSPTLVRVHQLNLMTDLLGDIKSEKNGELQKSMEIISTEGSGVILIIRPPNPAAVSNMIENNSRGGELREYGIGAQILLDLGIRDMILLTNTKKSLVGIEGYNLQISGTKEIK